MIVTNFFKDKKNFILAAIILLAIFLIFFRLDRADMQTDGAHYSLRAVGYLDFMMSDLQTTPIQWFKGQTIPWWGWLSFHDHPPLVFFVQHIFFVLFGVSIWVARLPVAAAGVGSVLLLYLIGKEIYSRQAGLLAALFLTLSTYFSWISRINYLEGVEIFFILLAVLFFFKGLKSDKFFLYFGLFLGLSLLTKFSAFFLLPVFGSYVLVKDRKLFLNKKLILGGVVALLVFSPVVVYNLMMFKSRGHFDVQGSQIFTFSFEQAKRDWPILFRDNQPSPDFWQNFLSSWQGLRAGSSGPFYWLSLAAAALLLIKFFGRPKAKENLFLVLSLFFLTLFFVFTGPTTRYLSVMVPFLVLSLAVVLVAAGEFLTILLKKKVWSFLPLAVVLPIASFELFYNVNTNLTYQPKGKKEVYYSSIRADNFGFRQLEDYLKTQFENKPYWLKKIKKINKFSDLIVDLGAVKGKDIFIYENNLQWFCTLWHFQRYFLYHNVYFISDLDLVNSLGIERNWMEFFAERGVKKVYFIKGADKSVLGPQTDNEERMGLSATLEKAYLTNLDAGAPVGVKEIKNLIGQVVFKVYWIDLEELK